MNAVVRLLKQYIKVADWSSLMMTMRLWEWWWLRCDRDDDDDDDDMKNEDDDDEVDDGDMLSRVTDAGEESNNWCGQEIELKRHERRWQLWKCPCKSERIRNHKYAEPWIKGT